MSRAYSRFVTLPVDGCDEVNVVLLFPLWAADYSSAAFHHGQPALNSASSLAAACSRCLADASDSMAATVFCIACPPLKLILGGLIDHITNSVCRFDEFFIIWFINLVSQMFYVDVDCVVPAVFARLPHVIKYHLAAYGVAAVLHQVL